MNRIVSSYLFKFFVLIIFSTEVRAGVQPNQSHHRMLHSLNTENRDSVTSSPQSDLEPEHFFQQMAWQSQRIYHRIFTRIGEFRKALLKSDTTIDLIPSQQDTPSVPLVKSQSIQSPGPSIIFPNDLDEFLKENQIHKLEDFEKNPDLLPGYKDLILRLYSIEEHAVKFDWVWSDVKKILERNENSWLQKRAFLENQSSKSFSIKILKNNLNFEADYSLGNTLRSMIKKLNTLKFEQSFVVGDEIYDDIQKQRELLYLDKTSAKEIRNAKTEFTKYLKNNSFLKKQLQFEIFKALDNWQPDCPDCLVNEKEILDTIMQEVSVVLQQRISFSQEIDFLVKKLFLELDSTDQFGLWAGFDPDNWEKKLLFIPSTKPLHAFWKGIHCKECVGGFREDSVTPERWGTSLVEDVELFFVYQINHFRQGHFVGFTQAVPVASRNHPGRLFGSIETSVAEFTGKNKTILFENQIIKGNLIEVFIDIYQSRLSPELDGLIKSDAGGFNQGGVGKTILKSEMFTLGKDLGSATDFFVADEKVSQVLIDSGHTQGSAGVYGGRMITDATVDGSLGRGAKIIRKLKNNNAKKIEIPRGMTQFEFFQLVHSVLQQSTN